jgi:hypothetical protein
MRSRHSNSIAALHPALARLARQVLGRAGDRRLLCLPTWPFVFNAEKPGPRIIITHYRIHASITENDEIAGATIAVAVVILRGR